MNNIARAIQVEILKARRSKMPLVTMLAFSLAPYAAGFFMIVLKDPELARRMGMISAKAQIVAGVADWPTFLGILSQATAIGGLVLFSLVSSWVFGREYSDRTIRNLLALPTPRYTIVLAKFILVLLWSSILVMMIYLIGLGVGAAIGLPLASRGTFLNGSSTMAVTAILTMAVATPIAFFASAGHGYLPPMGFSVFTVILAQIIAVTGWGEYFPWSIPALYAGVAGPAFADLGIISFVLVILTSLIGAIGTFVWWELADQAY
jgi:ABC-2 type transport system permease protein